LSYLLDSNSWISLLRWQNVGVLAKLKQHPDRRFSLSPACG
jgi:hypothetical protein